MGSDMGAERALQRLVVAPEQIQDNRVQLTSAQQHYLGRVLRLVAGEQFVVMDGRGHWWRAQLANGLDSACLLEVMPHHSELPVSVSVAVALPKGSGFDEVVRQLTELGAARILPVLSARTLMQPSSGRLARWRRIAQEATEQAERSLVPEVAEPLPFPDLLRLSSPETRQYLCVARGQPPGLLTLARLRGAETAILLATGPEGGWTEAEQQSAQAAGFQPVSLGARVLRAVTAPVVAMGLVAAALEAD